MTLKVAKRYFFLLKGTSLAYYKHEDSYTQGNLPFNDLISQVMDLMLHSIDIAADVLQGYRKNNQCTSYILMSCYSRFRADNVYW